ncbi:MAG: alpha-ketoglutarate-dependent dioxygenase AlkB [Gammaproteobacteria bacterium]|nr:MAG: alpha-ketoglutarate-dependent dioxygenase AlkB [Gammaproteobacteria bacterium]
MDLFDDTTHSLHKPINRLPNDGLVHYYGPVIPGVESNKFFQILLNDIQWEHDVAFMYGKKIVTPRKVAWYGDKPYQYTYSNNTKTALPWIEVLSTLKTIAEKASGEQFNACLLNLYHNGSEGMAWHSDDEKELTTNSAIGSLSFGAQRKFSFKHKQSKDTVSLYLEHGSLLIMTGRTQKNWQHRLPPTKKINQARINLTFRRLNEPS